ncbi:MAG: hypothetical protein ACJ8BW_13055 [Ktedonobacteraceae bacterium]
MKQEELGWLLKTSVQKLTVKVLAANRSDLEGAKQMLAPLNGLFPRLRHVWGNSHYGGTLVGWLREHLRSGPSTQALRHNLTI